MTDSKEKGRKSRSGKVAAAAAGAIGSAALAAAMLYVSRRKAKPTDQPPHPEHAPETD